MKAQIIGIACAAAAFAWVWFVCPRIVRLCGIPWRAAFWEMDWQSQRITRLQFVWAFGVLELGIGMFIVTAFPDHVERGLLRSTLSVQLWDLGFHLALSVFVGIVVASWCTPTLIGESPVIKLDLSPRP